MCAASLVAQLVKDLPAMRETWVQSIPGLGRSPGEGKGYPSQYSGLENSMDCKDYGVARSRTRLSDSHWIWAQEWDYSHMPTLFLVIWGTSKLFSIVSVTIYIPTNNVGRFSSPAFIICRLFSDFPGGTNGKESSCQCRRCQRGRFDPWVGKIPWSRKWQPTPVFFNNSHSDQYEVVPHCSFDLPFSNN